jgi:Flp pilus assembly protein TadG
VTLFVVVLTAALLAMAGLVIDGGYALAARQEAGSVAEQAARAGADAISRESLNGNGPLHVDPAAATRAAQQYLATTGHDGQVRVAGDSVTVTVRISRKTAILSVVGIDDLSSTSTATARGLTGIDRPEPAGDAPNDRNTIQEVSP